MSIYLDKTKHRGSETKLNAGGVLVGKRHSEGGIKAVNNSTGQPLEMEGGEVVITRDAVSDKEKREFEGKMLTNKEILSEINQSGGGISFAKGGEVDARKNNNKRIKELLESEKKQVDMLLSSRESKLEKMRAIRRRINRINKNIDESNDEEANIWEAVKRIWRKGQDKI